MIFFEQASKKKNSAANKIEKFAVGHNVGESYD